MRKNKIIQENNKVVPVEKIFNIFNSQFVRTSVPKDGKPDPKYIYPQTTKIKEVVFKPNEFLTPKEAIIQRALLGLVKMKFDQFDGNSEEFKVHEFKIYVSEIESVLNIDSNVRREIHSSFRKLKEMDIDIILPDNDDGEIECFGAIVNDLSHYKQRGYYTFNPSQLFQIMRKEEFREKEYMEVFHKITKEKKNELHYRQIHIQPSELLSLTKVQQAIMLYMLAHFEQSNGALKEEVFELNNNFYKSLFNTKEVSSNQSSRFKKAVNGLMEIEKYSGMFSFIGIRQLKVIYR